MPIKVPVDIGRVWRIDEVTGKLISPYDDIPTPIIKKAQAFTISITTISAQVFSRENLATLRYAAYGNFDLFILTSSSLGDRPLTNRIHFHTRKTSDEPVLDLIAPNIHLNEDYSGNERFYFELKLVSIPTSDDEFSGVTKAFQQLVGLAGSVFPAIAPVASVGRLAVDVFSRIFHKIETIPNEIISLPVAFFPAFSLGDAPLRVGSYVVFQTSRRVSNLVANNAAIVLDATGNPLAEPYFVVNVKDNIVMAPSNLPEDEHQKMATLISGQKMATLISQINTQEAGSARTLDFLRDTLASYRKFKLIERYYQLKEIATADRTPEENVRLDEIFKEVAAYVK